MKNLPNLCRFSKGICNENSLLLGTDQGGGAVGYLLGLSHQLPDRDQPESSVQWHSGIRQRWLLQAHSFARKCRFWHLRCEFSRSTRAWIQALSLLKSIFQNSTDAVVNKMSRQMPDPKTLPKTMASGFRQVFDDLLIFYETFSLSIQISTGLSKESCLPLDRDDQRSRKRWNPLRLGKIGFWKDWQSWNSLDEKKPV